MVLVTSRNVIIVRGIVIVIGLVNGNRNSNSNSGITIGGLTNHIVTNSNFGLTNQTKLGVSTLVD